jgi:hypothetical protein
MVAALAATRVIVIGGRIVRVGAARVLAAGVVFSFDVAIETLKCYERYMIHEAACYAHFIREEKDFDGFADCIRAAEERLGKCLANIPGKPQG